jgi:peptide deformylase
MTVRQILLFSKHENELRKKSENVQLINRKVRRVIRDLLDTLQANEDVLDWLCLRLTSISAW